jgi:putative membrane protein
MSIRNLLKLLALLCGFGLFIWMLSRFDMQDIVQHTMSIGLLGFSLILIIYCAEFLCDAAAWQLTITSIAPTPTWLLRLFKVRLVGEAVNNLTPLGGMGGEPVKAAMLKHHYQIEYTEGGASVILAKSLNVFSLVIFLALGLYLMHGDSRIAEELQMAASIGLALLAIGGVGLFIVQHLRISSRGMRKLAAHKGSMIERLQEFDEQLIHFYRLHRQRCLIALFLGFLNWVIGALGVMLSIRLMGYPLSFQDAWIIEAMAQMTRAAAFFIPASIGIQEGTFVLFVGTLTGNPALGLATALVRRGREIVWIGLGLVVGWRFLNPNAPRV